MAVAQANLKPTFTYRAVTSCLIQGLLQLTVALITFKIFKGETNISRIADYDKNFNWAETIAFITYKTYFRDNNTQGTDEPGWSHTAPATSRTRLWIMYYIAVCTVWVIASLFLLVFTPEHKKMNCYLRFYRDCWLVLTAIVVFSDAFASVQYLLDLRNTLDEQDYYNFIGFTPNETLCTYLPPCMKTAYKYTPPILMSLIFSRGLIGWILTVILLISAIKRFHKPKSAPEIEKAEEHPNDSDESSTHIEDLTSSTTTLSEVPATSSTATEQNYIPWMNVLYLPSIYEESNPGKVPEYYDEHHYEHVTGPHDEPGGITIEIPPRLKREPEDSSDYDENDGTKKTDPKLMKIDVGNICIRINQRSPRGEPAPPYRNLKFLKIPRVSGACSETDCNVHRAFNFMSVPEDKPHSDT